MSTITADPTLLLVLSQMKGVTEIRDEQGNLVGVYTPKAMTADDARKLFNLNKARERYEREKDQARPFREVLAKLKKMERAGAAKPKKRPRKTA
jgi:hypothetical protein